MLILQVCSDPKKCVSTIPTMNAEEIQPRIVKPLSKCFELQRVIRILFVQAVPFRRGARVVVQLVHKLRAIYLAFSHQVDMPDN